MPIPALAPVQDAQRPLPGAARPRDPDAGDRFERVLDGEGGRREAGSEAGPAADDAGTGPVREGGEVGRADAAAEAEDGTEEKSGTDDFRREIAAGDGTPEIDGEDAAAGSAGEAAFETPPDQSEWDAAVARALAQVGEESGTGADGDGAPETAEATNAEAAIAGETDATDPAGTGGSDGAATVPEGDAPRISKDGIAGPASTPGRNPEPMRGGDPASAAPALAPMGAATAASPAAAEHAREIAPPRDARSASGRDSPVEARRTDAADRPTPFATATTADQPLRPQPSPAGGGALHQAASAAMPDMQRVESDIPAPQHGAAPAPNATSADAPVRSAAPVFQAPSAPPMRQVADAVVTATGNRIEIALSPEELGTVRITISHSDAGLSLNLSADRQDTMGLLRRHAEELSKSLAEMGLGSADIGFSDDRRSREEGGRQPAFGSGAEPAAPLSVPLARPESLRAALDGRMDLRL